MSRIILIAKPVIGRIDCRILSPQRLQGKSLDEIVALQLAANLRVGDVFDVRIEAGAETARMDFFNTTAAHQWIGAGMNMGHVVVHGDAGDFLGAQMQNGVLICKGNVGDRAGDRMRRGLLLIEGNAGDYCASDMMAGTLGVLGHTGVYLGYGMRRGTLLLMHAPKLTATWIDCGAHTLPFLNLLYQSFKPLESRFASLESLRVQRWMGDMGGIGKAEILWLQH